MTPAILGLSHVGLSVRDLDAAWRFWVDVLGFELIEQQPTLCFVFDRGAGLAITRTDHDPTVRDAGSDLSGMINLPDFSKLVRNNLPDFSKLVPDLSAIMPSFDFGERIIPALRLSAFAPKIDYATLFP